MTIIDQITCSKCGEVFHTEIQVVMYGASFIIHCPSCKTRTTRTCPIYAFNFNSDEAVIRKIRDGTHRIMEENLRRAFYNGAR